MKLATLLKINPNGSRVYKLDPPVLEVIANDPESGLPPGTRRYLRVVELGGRYSTDPIKILKLWGYTLNN